jgi:hypothetical protein
MDLLYISLAVFNLSDFKFFQVADVFLTEILNIDVLP